MLQNILAAVHSWVVCLGHHDWFPVNPFVVDPAGPDRDTFAGLVLSGRREKYRRCSRCGLRDDGKGYDL